jgi:aminoglycoside phosphotransferase (APT) family kinase protein
MSNDVAGTSNNQPAWLPLLLKPYENFLGSRTMWDLRLPDGSPVRIERGSQGLNNALYRVRVGGDVFGCKLFVVDERRRADREWAALVAVQRAGLNLAPEPIAFAPDGPLPQPVIVYRWINGVPVVGQTLTQDELILLVKGLGRLHRTPPPAGLEPLTAWQQPAGYATYLADIETASDEVRRWASHAEATNGELPGWMADLPALLPLLEQVVEGARATVSRAGTDGSYPVKALVRLDGNLDNIMRDPEGEFVFVDWEYSGWGDAAYDLAELRWHPRGLQIGQKQWDVALAAYEPPPGDTTFAERLRVYSQLVPARWVGRSAVHLLEGAGQTSRRRRLAPVPQRMYRSVRKQLDVYLAALGLMALPEEEDEKEDD